MLKLPKSRLLPPRAGYKERLARWLEEWRLEQYLRKTEPGYADPLPRVRRGVVSNDPHWRRLGEPVIEDIAPLAGQIRLLQGWLAAEARRPVYVAVIHHWQPDTFVVAPYGPFLEPATATELLTGRDHDALRVLSLWNVRTIDAATLTEGSLHIDDLSAGELSDARDVFSHALADEGMSAELWDRVGCLIVHPQDPRIAYQDEEARMMALAVEPMEANVIEHAFDLPLAAGSVGAVSTDFEALVPSANVRVWVHASSSGESVFAEVFDAVGDQGSGRSLRLDGAALANAETGQVLATFQGGIARFALSGAVTKFAVLDAAGNLIAWRRQLAKS